MHFDKRPGDADRRATLDACTGVAPGLTIPWKARPRASALLPAM